MVKLKLVFPENKLSRAIMSITETEIILEGGDIPVDFSQEKIKDVKIVIVFDANGYYEFPLKVEKSENTLLFSKSNPVETEQDYRALVRMYSKNQLTFQSIQKIQTYFVDIEKTPFLKPSSQKALFIIGGILLLCGGVWWKWYLSFSSNKAVGVLKQEAFIYHSQCTPEINPGTQYVAKGADIGDCIRPIDSELRSQILFLKAQIQNYESQIPAFQQRNSGLVYKIGKELEKLQSDYEKAQKAFLSAKTEVSRYHSLKEGAVSVSQVDAKALALQQAEQTLRGITEQVNAKQNELELARQGVTLGGDPKDNLYNPAFLIKEAQAKLDGVLGNLGDKIISPVDGIYIPDFSRKSDEPLVTTIFSANSSGQPKIFVAFPVKLDEVADLTGKTGFVGEKKITVIGRISNPQVYFGLPQNFGDSDHAIVIGEFQEPIDISTVGQMYKVHIRGKSFYKRSE